MDATAFSANLSVLFWWGVFLFVCVFFPETAPTGGITVPLVLQYIITTRERFLWL